MISEASTNTSSSYPTSALCTTTIIDATRTVARPVANLGNTCYMNAVLQALAHAPELCLAMDCKPHCLSCPIAAANNAVALAKQQHQLQQQLVQNESQNQQQARLIPPQCSPSSSPEAANANQQLLVDSVSGAFENGNCSVASSTVGCGGTSGGVATRKSRRTGRKSPKIGDADASSPGSSNDTNGGSSGNGINGLSSLSSGVVPGNAFKFCALCEIEHHLRQVHDLTFRDRPVAPETFVHGFFKDVAPWFKLGVQEDSHEFLRLLIDAMQKSCRKARTSSRHIDQLLSSDKHSPSEADSEIDMPNSLMENSSRVDGRAETTIDGEQLGLEDSAPSKEDFDTHSSKLNEATEKNQNAVDTEYPFSLFRGTVESKVVCCYCQAISSTLDPIEDVGLEVTALDGMNASALNADCLARTTRNSTVNSGAGISNHSSIGTAANSPPTSHPALSTSSSSSLLDVQTAFQRFASTEALDSGYKCEKCGKGGRATKQSRLASIPPILTLHLKRFRYGGSDGRTSGGLNSLGSSIGNGSGTSSHPIATRTTRSTRSSEVSQLLGSSDYFGNGKSGSTKIEGHIKFDPVFDLGPYLTQELQEQHANMFCRLFAVIVHAGKNSHSGHYVAYVRNVTKNEWCKMDDSRVSPVTLPEVLNAEAYMLFYRVVQHPISMMLEELHNKKKQEQFERTKVMEKVAEVLSNPSTTTVTAVVNNSSSVIVTSSLSKAKNKKRSYSFECKEAEEWLLTKTKIPRQLIGLVRKSQELIAKEMELKPNSQKKIINTDLSSTIDSGPSSPCSIITEDDIVGGTDRFRRKLVHMFYKLQGHQQNRSLVNGTIDTANDDNIPTRPNDWFTPPQIANVNGSCTTTVPTPAVGTIKHPNPTSVAAEMKDVRMEEKNKELELDVESSSKEPSRSTSSGSTKANTAPIELDRPKRLALLTSRVTVQEPEDSVGLL